MTIVDWVLVGAVIAFAWAGWRQGFVVGVLSFAGFLAGGLAAVALLPSLVEQYLDQVPVRAAVLAGAILACAVLGQVVSSLAGRGLRNQLTWSPAQFIDHAAGAALNVLALAIVTWIVASALAYLPATAITAQVRSSTMVGALDALVPDQVRDGFTRLRDAVGSTAAPRVFSTLAEVTGPDVSAPAPEAVQTGGVRRARRSVVRISGPAPACQTSLTGSGFVYAPGLVMTNAHVVAGMTDPMVQVPSGPAIPARVVVFDPRLDAAVLLVPGLDVPALDLSVTEPRTQDDAAALGYPGGGDLRVTAVRVRAVIPARGEDIYGKSGVERSVVAFRGQVEPGNSGGPLVSPRGSVFGMVFGAGISSPDTGYALTAADLVEVARDGQQSTAEVSTGSCLTR